MININRVMITRAIIARDVFRDRVGYVLQNVINTYGSLQLLCYQLKLLSKFATSRQLTIQIIHVFRIHE